MFRETQTENHRQSLSFLSSLNKVIIIVLKHTQPFLVLKIVLCYTYLHELEIMQDLKSVFIIQDSLS